MRTTSEDTADTQLESLWVAHRSEVHAFVRRRTTAAAADDIVAETFACAVAALHRGKHVDVRWLMTVARRRLVDGWRKEHRTTELPTRVCFDRTLTRSDVDPREHVGFVSDEIACSLLRLSPRQREAIVLRYLHGFSVSEVAASMSIRYSAAESLLARGRSGARRELLDMESASSNAD